MVACSKALSVTAEGEGLKGDEDSIRSVILGIKEGNL